MNKKTTLRKILGLKKCFPKDTIEIIIDQEADFRRIRNSYCGAHIKYQNYLNNDENRIEIDWKQNKNNNIVNKHIMKTLDWKIIKLLNIG